MNDQEKNALLQFMGQVYGETKKHDQMLVGSTANLRPKSDEIKNIFEQTLRTNTQPNSQPTPPAPQPAEPASIVEPPIIDPQQAVSELAAVEAQSSEKQPPVSQPVEPVNIVTESQLEFDLNEPAKVDQIIKLIEQQNKLLTNINTGIQQLCKQIDLISNQPKLQSKRNGTSTTRKKSE